MKPLYSSAVISKDYVLWYNKRKGFIETYVDNFRETGCWVYWNFIRIQQGLCLLEADPAFQSKRIPKVL